MWNPLSPDDLAALPEPWREPLAGFAATLKDSGHTRSTQGEYQRFTADLARYAPHPWRVTPGDLSAWLETRRWAESTRRKALNAVRRFYGYGTANGHLLRSPVIGLSARPEGHNRPGPAQTHLSPAWREPVTAYLTHLAAAGRSPNTARVRRVQLSGLGLDFADPWTITPDDLANWLASPDLAQETRRQRRATVRDFYAWAERTERISSSPAAGLPVVPQLHTLPRPMPDDVLAAALSHADHRTRLAILLGALAGLRRAEIAAVHRDDLTPDGALIVHGKGRHERAVPLHPDLARALRAEYATRDARAITTGAPAPGWLFPSTDATRHLSADYLGRLITRVLPAGVTPHTLRHRFATQAYAHGGDLLAVQTLLGHARPETTARYAQVAQQSQRAALAGVHLPGLAPDSTPPPRNTRA